MSSSTHDSDWVDVLIARTEQFLTWRKRRKHAKHEKQKKKNVIVDWIEAFIWAAFVVLLINQYLLQAYQIPSSSMVPTLLQRDRIFVNKVIYGPELVPGQWKVPGFVEPDRFEVVIFENPSYLGRGVFFDILQRVIYMMTLALVDIDRDETGEVRAHFLIKRAIGVPGDRFRQEAGNLLVRPEGEAQWYTEAEFQQLSGASYPVRRMISPDHYPAIRYSARVAAYEAAGLPLLEDPTPSEQAGVLRSDFFERNRVRSQTLFQISPHNERERSTFVLYEAGWYVPDNRILPLGDNRDNSRDGRYFGPVSKDKVLGRAMFKYWPPARIGAIR